ncbi:pilus assembly protein PilM [Chloroflexota bacterium]
MRKRKVITLDINNTDIRLMEAERGRVTRWASRSLEANMFEDGVISVPQALSAAIRQLMTSSGIIRRNVIASVSGLYSLSRIVMVPTRPGESVTQQAVLEAANEVMPLSEDEQYLSWHIIAPVEGGQQVLVLGVPRDIVDSEVQALGALGINLRVLDFTAMALARAVNREEALIFNIESATFDLVVVVGGVIAVMRTTAWQQNDLSVEEKVELLVSALEMTVDFYNSQYHGTLLDPATPLFITGQMSGNLTLMKEIEARVEYPIEPLAPPLEYPEHLPVSQYAVNIGLALKGIAASKTVGQGGYSPPDINLLPEIYRPWKPSPKQIQSFFAVMAAIALLLPIYNVTSGAMDKTADLKANYNVVNSLLIQRQALIKEREPLQQAIDKYNDIIDMGGGFTEDLEVINSEAERLGIEIKSISHTGIKITFACSAETYTDFRDYLTALEESGRFTTPIPPPEGYPYVKSGIVILEPKPGE